MTPPKEPGYYFARHVLNAADHFEPCQWFPDDDIVLFFGDMKPWLAVDIAEWGEKIERKEKA